MEINNEEGFLCNLVGGSSHGKSFYIPQILPRIRIPIPKKTNSDEIDTEIYKYSHQTYLKKELWYFIEK